MEKRFEFVKAVGAFAQDVEEEINFAGRKAFEGHALKRKAPVPRTGWRFWKSVCSIIENAEPAARHVRKQIAAAEAEVPIRAPAGIADEIRAISIRIDRVFRQKNGIVVARV